MTLRILKTSDPRALGEAVDRLSSGGLVALPTETVYGLAADIENAHALARIFEAKGRPRFNPLIAHVDGLEMALKLVHFSREAQDLAEVFWPGPLTLVLPLRADAGVPPLASAGLPTLALRQPRGLAGSVIRSLGRAVAAPSANRSGGVSPTRAEHVVRSLGERVDLVLDGGPCDLGLESTIVKPGDGELMLLRPGAVTAEEIAAVTGREPRLSHGPAIEAPGQMASHYAPAGRVRLDARSVEAGEYLIGFGGLRLPGEDNASGVINLSEAGDLREAAANLFSALSAYDAPHIARIAVAPIPGTGLGVAINDRLARAAAPR